MGDSEENLDFMLFLDNYVPEIEKTCVKNLKKKKRHIKNIVNEIHEEIFEFFSDLF